MIVVLVLAPARPVRARSGGDDDRRSARPRAARALALALRVVLLAGWPSARCCCRRASTCSLNEIAILALFALSLDLILGYAGIVSLGHAAFFGFGAYAAGLFAKHVMPRPAGRPRRRHRCRGGRWASLTSFLVLRGSDLTRLMVTLGVALVLHELANKLDGLTGGADGLQGVVDGPAARAASSSTCSAAPPMPTA